MSHILYHISTYIFLIHIYVYKPTNENKYTTHFNDS